LFEAHVHVIAVLVVDHSSDLLEGLAVVPLDLGIAQVLRPLFEIVVDMELAAFHRLVGAIAVHEPVIDIELVLLVAVYTVVRQAGKQRVVFAAVDVLSESWRDTQQKQQSEKHSH
jgi:hypothetical protein